MPTIRESLETETRGCRQKYDLCAADPRKGGNARDADLKAMHEHSVNILKLIASMSLPANATEVTRLNGMDPAHPGPGEGGVGTRAVTLADTNAWAATAAQAFARAMPADAAGRKSLVSGTIGLPSPIAPEVVTISQMPRRILDCCPGARLSPASPMAVGTPSRSGARAYGQTTPRSSLTLSISPRRSTPSRKSRIGQGSSRTFPRRFPRGTSRTSQAWKPSCVRKCSTAWSGRWSPTSSVEPAPERH